MAKQIKLTAQTRVDAGRSAVKKIKRQGFVPGMTIPDDAKAAITHAGLFSLFVRTLASEISSGSALPRVLPEGQVILGQL